MLTFQNIYEEVQEQVQDDSATSLVLIKRAINQGAKKFGAVLNREWRQSEKIFSLVADQQYYQLPEDAIRLRWITVTIGSVAYPLTEIADEDTWRDINMTTTTSSIPTHYYVRGNDEFGIYPTPSATVASAGRISYERRMRDMAQADYSTGTITVTNADATITHSGTGFSSSMIGRWFSVTDGSADGMWYRISAYTDTSNMELENTYAGTTGSGRTFIIGEIPDIPEEFHESLIDYACYRYYRRRRDNSLAREMRAVFEDAIDECRSNYSTKTGSQYYKPVKLGGGSPFRRIDRRVQ